MREEHDAERQTELVPLSGELPVLEEEPPPEPGLLSGTDPIAEPVEDLADELLEVEEPPLRPPTRAERVRARLGEALMITGGVIGLLVIVYAVDLVASAGNVPRGVTVAGVDVGGLSRQNAESVLHEKLEPRLTQPIPLRAGDVSAELDPSTAGLGLDWQATLQQAGSQPLNPITRLLSFFTSREVGVVTKSAPGTLAATVSDLAKTRLDHALVEGSIGFAPIPDSDGGVRPYPIDPRQGQRLVDVDGAVTRIVDNWLKNPIELPMEITPPKATPAGVRAALDELVAPAVAQPVVAHGNGKDGVLKPEHIAGAFQFAALDGGALEVKVDQNKLRDALQPQLASTEKQGRDAQIVFTGERPTVQPSEDGRKISWENTFRPYMEVIKKTEGRALPVSYETQKPKVSTQDAAALGINEVVGEFNTSGATGDAARNVTAMAGKVNGAIIKPGETFSLDTFTGPRTSAQGYVPAPAFEDGTGPTVIGGGVSQFTTTLYNAVYLAGLADAGHAEHPYFLDRYPPARDAISIQADGSSVDLRFTNDAPTGVAIQTYATGGTVSVKIWGTKRFRVESSTSGRTDVRPPGIGQGEPGECRPAFGSPGFTITDTRTLYDLGSGAPVRTDSRTATYQPRPTLLC